MVTGRVPEEAYQMRAVAISSAIAGVNRRARDMRISEEVCCGIHGALPGCHHLLLDIKYGSNGSNDGKKKILALPNVKLSVGLYHSYPFGIMV